MDYAEFKTRFGGSYRTKNLNLPLDTAWKKTSANKRVHHLDRRTELPAEFIRLDPWEGEYLFLVARRARLGVVEIGRFNGGSAFLLACAAPGVPIHSIDVAPQDDDRLRALLAATGVGGNLDLVAGDSQRGAHPDIGGFDLLFVDGDHSYEGCTADLRNWWDRLAPGGHVVLHDCYGGSPVMDAVLDFIADKDVQLYRSPYIPADHWTAPAGSMMHFAKRHAAAVRTSKG